MLFKTIQDIKNVVPIIGSSNFTSFKPFIKQAERDFLIPMLSKEQYDLLDSHYNSVTPVANEELELLTKCQEAVGLYLIYLWIPSGQVSMGDNGIRINTTETLKTAFQWQIDDLSRSTLRAAGSAMDSLLEFLEEKKDIFTEWATSTSYLVFKECFINTTALFTSLYSPLGNSRLNFVAIRSSMINAQEFDLKPILGEEYYAELLEQFMDDDLTPANIEVMKLARKALAPLTMRRAFTDLVATIDDRGILNFNNTGSSQVLNQKQPAKDYMLTKLEMAAEKNGAAHLQKLKEYLHANIGSYPTYSGSSAYDSETTDHSFTNDEEAGNFFMG